MKKLFLKVSKDILTLLKSEQVMSFWLFGMVLQRHQVIHVNQYGLSTAISFFNKPHCHPAGNLPRKVSKMTLSNILECYSGVILLTSDMYCQQNDFSGQSNSLFFTHYFRPLTSKSSTSLPRGT